MVENAVENRGGNHLVAEDVAPLRDGLIGGDEHAASFVASADELKNQVSGLLLEGEVAQFVDDEQLGLGVERDLVGEFALRLRTRELSSEVAVTNSTECPASTAARPSPIARWVLPTPGGPSMSTFSAPAMKRPVASSRTSFWSTDGWNLKSNSSIVFTVGKCAIWIPIATRFFCFASVSSARIWSRNSRYVGSARAACDRMLSSRCATAPAEA